MRRNLRAKVAPSEPPLGPNLRPKIPGFIASDRSNPAGKLAEAELHFKDGVLAGLKLIGFAIWERRAGSGRNVTFPARQYSVNGERRSFALLRPAVATTAHSAVRELILEAFAEYEKHAGAD